MFIYLHYIGNELTVHNSSNRTVAVHCRKNVRKILIVLDIQKKTISY